MSESSLAYLNVCYIPVSIYSIHLQHILVVTIHTCIIVAGTIDFNEFLQMMTAKMVNIPCAFS